MAYFRIGTGGSMKSTLLWSNSNPSSSFTAQDVNLADSISNYDYIKFTFCVSTTSTSNVGYNIYPASYVLQTRTGTDSNPGFIFYIGGLYRNYQTGRWCYHYSDTKLYIGHNNYSGTGGGDNALVIPLSITGMKYVSSGGSPTTYTLMSYYTYSKGQATGTINVRSESTFNSFLHINCSKLNTVSVSAFTGISGVTRGFYAIDGGAGTGFDNNGITINVANAEELSIEVVGNCYYNVTFS